MSIGLRHLTVLGEFKPFGLIAEALDGKPADCVTDKYDYFLFDSEVTRQQDEADEYEAASCSSDQSDHELFIRGNRIIWTIGSRVYKRFTLPSSVIMACWCRMGNMSEALLCVLQVDSLTIYNTSGEVVSIPLPHTITSIWPLPSGLLLQQAAESNSPTHVPFSSSSPLFPAHEISRPRRDTGYSPQNNFKLTSALDYIVKVDGATMSSHLILKDPLEEPQPVYIEERGKLNTMKEFDEKTIWTSDRIPLMASYNKGKMQHSLWAREVVNSNLEAANSKIIDIFPAEVLAKKFSFRRIWQGKGAQTAASQAQLWQLAQRTTALPVGRGAFTLATTCTLLTEALTVPKLILAGRLPAQQNATVNLDPNIRNIQELKSWPEFHNAVAAGLRLAPLQGKMSRTWIIYNKPEEPNVIHAGLLLALGLHGHLRVLIITDLYQYFSQEHESTTVGLMLGLAASYRGTMHPAISKSLFVHIPARHPSSFPELELPTLLQSAALVSVGLLYEGSAHPQTMQILLGEIGRRSGGDNVLEREGYAVSAGFSLGLVALGHGIDALGFMDTLVDRLFQYVGGKELYNERSLLLTLSTDDHNRGTGQMMDGTQINIDVTAPGAIIALALMYLKTESQVTVSRLCIPHTHFDLQYVRPDFIMLRVIARNLIMWSRVRPSEDWIQNQIPKIVLDGVKGLGDEMGYFDEMDAEAFVKAYVNIVAGACISLGLRFAGTKDGNAQELLYSYAISFLNEINPVSVTNVHAFPNGLSHYVDRGTLETCLHLIVLSLSVIMAGSGHLQTFRFLRFLRCRNSADGHVNYGTQMAVSLAIGFLFLGGGTRTFSTSNSSIAALLITLYPRLPTGPNDNRCHLQAFRHLYVLATEARWVQTVDVDTGLPVYAPLEVTIKETDHYAETSFCEVTPCILPERALLKTVRVCGPRYWPQVIELNPEVKPWWNSGDNNNPFNSGILYIKRKVGACSYVDDPIGRQSLLSRAMHKVFGLASLRACTPNNNDDTAAVTVNQLVSTFSSDPSLIAFAALCTDPSWNCRSDADFQEFCLQVLFECVSKDRPALLQVYLSLYTTVGSMADLVISGTSILNDSQFVSSLKLAVAYNEALLNGRLTTSRGGIVQSTFLGSLNRRVEEVLNYSPFLRNELCNYFKSGRWPGCEDSQEGNMSTLLSWYLQWYAIPAPSVIKTAVERLKSIQTPSSVPLLRLLLPGTHINAISEIDKFRFSSIAQPNFE